nr:unnamed protein product [Callosobruchus analis]
MVTFHHFDPRISFVTNHKPSLAISACIIIVIHNYECAIHCAVIVEESQTLKFWTSGKKYGTVWLWDSTGHPTRYTNWAPGQPSKKGRRKTCIEAMLNTTAQNLLWNAVDCTVSNYFICESPIHG